ncbi:MAG: sugar ABC transporter permease [Anaerolineae bacterium]|nr:sugar ABC transporter permease [Anaerolineae bacterium]
MIAATTKKESRTAARFRLSWRSLVPFWLLLPSLIFLAVLQLYPVIYSLYISLHRLRAGQYMPVGFRNFERLFADTNFYEGLAVSFRFVGISLVLTIGIGMLVAVLLNQRSQFNALYMVLMFVPWVVSDVVAGTIWRWLFQQDYGIIQNMIQPLTGSTSLYAKPDGALLIVILATVWRGLPFTSLLFLGALQNVSTEVIESAALDGANRWKTFFRVTLPIIRPTLIVAVILTTIAGLNSVGVILTLTGNIPATQTVSVYLYEQGWQFGDFGLGAAISVVMFFINLGLTLVYLRFQRQD